MAQLAAPSMVSARGGNGSTSAPQGSRATVDYQPRPAFLPFHMRTQRMAAMVCHRRAGKTVACVGELVDKALKATRPNSRYAYFAPFRSQAKDVAWTYLKDMVRAIPCEIRESELRIKLPNGAWITLYGSDNPDAVRGLYLDGVILDEYGDCRPNLWGEILRPLLMDRQGWAVFIGTPKGDNHFSERWDFAVKNPDRWFSLMLKASTSGLLSPAELADAKLEMSKEEWDQEMECSFSAGLRGAYYADQLAELEATHQRADVEFVDDLPIHLAADIGWSDSTAIWFWQERADGIAIADYYEDHHKRVDQYITLLNSHPRRKQFGTFWMPHDGFHHNVQTGRTTANFLYDAGFHVERVPRAPSIQDGIEAVRRILPVTYFNSAKCHDGLLALKNYRRNYNPVTKSFDDAPIKRHWSKHGSDALRYLALVARSPAIEAVFQPPSKTTTPKPADDIKTVQSMTFDEMFDDHARAVSLNRRRRMI